MVKGLRGFIQGYNAQPVTNEHRVVIAAEMMTAAPDFGHLEPMLDVAQCELDVAGVTETPGVFLAREGARPDWEGGLYAFMRRVLGERARRRALPPAPADD